ncbi:MAG: PEGA domain-containing protein, partial [Gammaproteobacteria bacterium]|nr:PEGA domain-containing protein [Gammaproteobacteria bacterium]
MEILSNNETTISAELNIKTGTICVNSKPTGAKVLIEGNEVGNTPVTKPDLKPGVQNVEIQMEGYETWNEKVEVVPDKESVITAELKMETGSLSINSEPTNANVSIDGKVVGKTPATISDLNPGTYNVEVKIDDHIDWKESVEILSNNETTISAELNIKTGTVCVNSKPTGAKVLIEGNEVGNTPVTKPDLKPGIQNVEIQMEGYETWNEKVEVVPDKESAINAELKMET